MSEDTGIKFTCPHCSQSLEAESDMAGQTIECPTCQKTISIPVMRPAKPHLAFRDRPVAQRQAPPVVTHACKYCGAQHAADAVLCVGCGRNVKTGKPLQTPVESAPRSAPPGQPIISTGAVLLLVVLAGGGYFVWQQMKKEPVAPTSLNVSSPASQPSQIPAQTKREPAPPQEVKKASLQGGFWITKGSGASDVVRGNDVYLLAGEVKTDSVRPLLQELEPELSKRAAEYEQKGKSGDTFASVYASHAPLNALAASSARLYQRLDTIPVSQLRFIIRAYNTSTYSDAFTLSNIGSDKRWPQILRAALVASTQSGIDGKYQFPALPPGKYAVVAMWESGFNYAEWCLDADLEPGQTYTLDIHNGNAAHIWSKKED